MSEESKAMLEQALKLYYQAKTIIDKDNDLYYEGERFYEMVCELESILNVKLNY